MKRDMHGNTNRRGTCPRCGTEWDTREATRRSYHPAVSRRDNETLVCTTCGVVEALEDAGIITRDPDLRVYWRMADG